MVCCPLPDCRVTDELAGVKVIPVKSILPEHFMLELPPSRVRATVAPLEALLIELIVCVPLPKLRVAGDVPSGEPNFNAPQVSAEPEICMSLFAAGVV